MTTETSETSVIDRPEEPDYREGGEMTLLEHLLELRSRVMWSAIAVLAGMAVFFIPPIGFPLIEGMLAPARKSIPDFRPQYIEPMENIATYFRVALLGGLTLGMPMLVYQALRFVTPALTPSEKRWIYPIVLGASLAFLGGLAFAYYIVLPFTLKFLLTFGSDFAQADWRIGNYIDFVTRMMLVLGVIFQMPLFVMGLAKFGVVNAGQLLHYWRFAIVGAFVLSAVATPTIDPVTQSMVAGPVILLYFIGIGLAWLVRRG